MTIIIIVIIIIIIMTIMTMLVHPKGLGDYRNELLLLHCWEVKRLLGY